MTDTAAQNHAKTADALASWRRMLTYMQPYRRWAVLAFCGVLITVILQTTLPLILRTVIDYGVNLGSQGYPFMLLAGGLICGLAVIRGASSMLLRYFGERLSHYVAYDIRNEVYDKVQRLPFAYHNKTPTGTLITRAISDVDEIQRYFAYGFIDGVNIALLLVCITVAMFFISPYLTLAAIIPLIPLMRYSQTFIIRVAPKWRNIMNRIQKLSNHLQENILGAAVVRAYAREEHEKKLFAEQNELLFHEQLALVNQWTFFFPASAFLVATAMASVLFFGGVMAISELGNVTVGTVTAFNTFVFMLAQPLRFLGFVILLTTQAATSSQRVFEILDTPNPIQSQANAPQMPRIKGHVIFEDVSFQFEDGESPTLHHISLEALPGQAIALLGATGSGKTTVINLIPRFFDVTEGRILIDGQDIREVDLHSLRRQIGFVLQESLLFSASIADNIAYGHPEASDEEILRAARAANAHEFIQELPDGYQTIIGERGITLSGGQRQRVAIARAILIDPCILILDDSTSSVDTHTEVLIQLALRQLMQNRTTFVIAQRLSSVMNADQIIVLDEGHIVEQGTHEELLQLNGYYHEIYELQLADQERTRAAIDPKHKHLEEKRATVEFQQILDRMGRH
ncbi:MAG: ABC transporter ATP-binding protein [Anaerolineaceae bacterium]|nr:ABC transporter ATP-binding protein [Anaerolineaceae bacterium]